MHWGTLICVTALTLFQEALAVKSRTMVIKSNKTVKKLLNVCLLSLKTILLQSECCKHSNLQPKQIFFGFSQLTHPIHALKTGKMAPVGEAVNKERAKIWQCSEALFVYLIKFT